MPKATPAPDPPAKKILRRTKDQEQALEWVKERARPRDTKHTALPEAEGAAIGEPARPAKIRRRKR
jgi:hypothetical protein